ncbi:uncharacterized protein LOC119669627 [Teleopsis dalmanni]|uniref:uncharacterized protein LOC119669627 n=1 Tax=Teleopsis dalmanni TaxID=139649 RepID=UPI0018CF4C3A|nr:uncharacterized protein LOC119669627 [Teleopsis dalmanni]
MVAIEHRQISSSSTTTTTAINNTVLSPASSTLSSQSTASSSASNIQPNCQHLEDQQQAQPVKSTTNNMSHPPTDTKDPTENMPKHTTENVNTAATVSKSAVSQRNVDIKISKNVNTKEITKKVLKLDLTGKELDEYSLKSPKSPITARLPHQASLTSSVDVEDRKTLRDALYQGIFHRHRRTIFAVGSFLRMLRSRNSQYNTIRSSSEGEDIDEVR